MPTNTTTKDCPFCAEEIKAAAKYCRHCRNWLEEPERKPGQVAEVEVIAGSAEEDAAIERAKLDDGDFDVIKSVLSESQSSAEQLARDVLDVKRELYDESPEGRETFRSVIGFLEKISLKGNKRGGKAS